MTKPKKKRCTRFVGVLAHWDKVDPKLIKDFSDARAKDIEEYCQKKKKERFRKT